MLTTSAAQLVKFYLRRSDMKRWCSIAFPALHAAVFCGGSALPGAWRQHAERKIAKG